MSKNKSKKEEIKEIKEDIVNEEIVQEENTIEDNDIEDVSEEVKEIVNEKIDEIEDDEESDEQPGKSMAPMIIIVLILVVLTIGGTILFIKKDEIFKTDNTKVEEPKKENKIEEQKNEIKETETNENKEVNNTPEESKYQNQSGSLSTESDSSALIKINDKDYKLTYSFVEDENGPGTMYIKLGSNTIYEAVALNGIGDLTYNVFTAADNKQYLFVSYKQWGEYGYIVNDEGKTISKISEYSDELKCFVGSNENEDLMGALGEDVLYYRYKKDSKTEDNKIKLEQVKLSINNNSVTESLTGEEKDGSANQCN